MRNLIYIVLGLLGSLALQAQDASCWGNFRGDDQLTGVSQATLPERLQLQWNFSTGGGIKASPVACDGVVVVGTVDGALLGISYEGKLLWKITTENSIEAPALIRGGIVYAGNLDGELFAIDLKAQGRPGLVARAR